MAWTNFGADKAAGNPILSADWNTYVKANLTWVHDLITAGAVGQVSVKNTGAVPLVLDRTEAAAILPVLALQRAEATKFNIGLDASDNFTILNAAGDTALLSLTSAGLLTATTLAGTLSTAAQPNVTSLGTLASLAISGNLTVDTTTLAVDATNNRIGIGIAAPDVLLHLSQAATPEIRITHSTTSSYGLIHFFEGAVEKAAIQLIGSTFATTSRRNSLELLTSAGPIVFFPEGASTPRFYVNGSAWVGINAASNVNVTTGLTINQGAADDQILALKSSDIAHGITDYAETDSYGQWGKVHATQGGLRSWGFSTSVIACQIIPVATSDDTTKATNGRAPLFIDVYKKSGTGVGAAGADANILAVSTNGNSRFIVDAEGDIHSNSASYGNAVISGSTVKGYNTYDAFDDVQLVRALEVERHGRGLLRTEFDQWLKYGREDLTQLNLATFNDGPDGDGSVFVNYTGLVRLHSGAIWQLAQRNAELERQNLALLARLERVELLLPAGDR